MSKNIVEITSDNFKEEVINYSGTVIVDFWASWCGPCRMIAPILEEIAFENQSIKIAKVNTDNNPELASEYGIRSIPTIIYFKDGEQYDQTIGAIPKEQIEEKII